MYDDPYDEGGGMEDVGFHSRSSLFHHPREDFLSASRGFQKHGAGGGRVFISRSADIAIALALVLAAGLGGVWLVGQVPAYLESASAHYYWAMDLYNTWGTPSMRWLFINLVVGVIVATSGLLSAFGGGGGRAPEPSRQFKGRVYEGAHPPSFREPVGASAYFDPYHTTSARFAGAGYEFPAYNPYLQPVKLGPDPAVDFGAGEAEEGEEEIRKEEIVEKPEAASAAAAAEDAAPPAEVVSREIPAGDGEIFGAAVEEEEQLQPAAAAAEGDAPPAAAAAADVAVPEAEGALREAAEELKSLPAPPAPEISESGGDGGGGGEDAVAIISKVYDPDGEAAPQGKHQRVKTDPAIDLAGAQEEAEGGLPGRPDGLPKSRTFTIGRVIRRDQLADFIEPLSRKLESIGRKVRLDPLKDSHAEPRDIAAASSAASDEARDPPPPPPPGDAATHRRRHSAESVPTVAHRRRLSSESLPSAGEGGKPRLAIQPAAAIANQQPPPPPTPSLSKRSIVYPPALLSQASIPAGEPSPPPSPPIEKAIPPPPPPHLKLPGALQGKPPGEGSGAGAAAEKSPSGKPPVQGLSKDEKKALAAKHERAHSAASKDGGEGAAVQERALTVTPPKPSSSSEIQEVEGSPGDDKQESPSVKGDDLQQQIDDFLARFHENWRLQRQESLARYKKKLEGPDD